MQAGILQKGLRTSIIDCRANPQKLQDQRRVANIRIIPYIASLWVCFLLAVEVEVIGLTHSNL